MTNQEFITYLVPRAQSTYTMYGIFASVTIAQAIWESAWGTSNVATVDKNLFGIKLAGQHDPSLTIAGGTFPTDGDQTGQYCRYQDWGDSIQDHGYFLKNNIRYTESGVFSATNCFEQLQAIANGGYAEDPNYYAELSSVITDNNLQQYDTGTPPVDPPVDPPIKKVKLKNNYLFNMTDKIFGRKFTSKNKEFDVIRSYGNVVVISDDGILHNVPLKNIIK